MNKITVEYDACEGNYSLVNVTNDREACQKYWIAALVQINCEKRSASKLAKLGYETYVPTQSEIHQWSDRKRKIDKLLIPCVIFIRCTTKDEEWLRKQTLIHKLLALPGSKEEKLKLATAIPDAEIDQLKFLLQKASSNVTIETKEVFADGDQVRVTSGPIKGLIGKVQIVNDKNILSIDVGFFGCAKIHVDKSVLEKI